MSLSGPPGSQERSVRAYSDGVDGIRCDVNLAALPRGKRAKRCSSAYSLVFLLSAQGILSPYGLFRLYLRAKQARSPPVGLFHGLLHRSIRGVRCVVAIRHGYVVDVDQVALLVV